MPKNNAKKWAIIAAVITLAGIGLAAGSLSIGEGDNFGLFMIGLLLAITFFICFFVFIAQSRRLDRMFRQEELLVHWQFDKTEQMVKIEEEYAAKRKFNRTMLLVILAFFVVIGGLFTVFGFDDFEDAAGFLLILLGVFAIIAAAALLAPGMSYRKMRNSPPDVFVGPFGAWVMGEFTLWKTAMTQPRQVSCQGRTGTLRIEVEYEIWQRSGWQKHTCRIPVPAGRETEAEAVAARIAQAVFGDRS